MEFCCQTRYKDAKLRYINSRTKLALSAKKHTNRASTRMQVLAYTKFVFGCMGLCGDKSRHAGTWAVYGSALFTINFVVVTTTAFVLLCYDNPDLLVPNVFSLLYIVAFFVSGAFYFIEMLQRNAIFEALNDVQAIVNKRKCCGTDELIHSQFPIVD